MSPDANRPPVERRVGVRRAGARGGALGGAALAGDVLLAELATLLLGGAAPHAGVLVGGEGVLEARGLGLALPAHGLGVLDLLDCGARGAHGEEEVGIGVATGRYVAPVAAPRSEEHTAELQPLMRISSAVLRL